MGETASALEKLPTVIIACQVMESMLNHLLPEKLVRNVTYMDCELHRVPARMTRTLQNAVDAINTPSLVALGYGLCGNGLDGIQAGEHTLLVPRVDDCISILLGSRQAYIREFEAVAGTYYLSKGWLKSGSHPLSERNEYAEKYGAKEADWIMDQQYQNYNRLMLVAHREKDLEKYRSQALEVARYCERWDMRYEEFLGSDRYVRRLIELIQTPHAVDDEFILIPPGGKISQEQFIR